jgi:hypothetical protein
MKSSTKGNLMGDRSVDIVGEDWEQIIACIPGEIDLEATAQQTKALQRRREIKSGADLLRMVLAYAICN